MRRGRGAGHGHRADRAREQAKQRRRGGRDRCRVDHALPTQYKRAGRAGRVCGRDPVAERGDGELQVRSEGSHERGGVRGHIYGAACVSATRGSAHCSGSTNVNE